MLNFLGSFCLDFLPISPEEACFWGGLCAFFTSYLVPFEGLAVLQNSKFPGRMISKFVDPGRGRMGEWGGEGGFSALSARSTEVFETPKSTPRSAPPEGEWVGPDPSPPVLKHLCSWNKMPPMADIPPGVNPLHHSVMLSIDAVASRKREAQSPGLFICSNHFPLIPPG